MTLKEAIAVLSMIKDYGKLTVNAKKIAKEAIEKQIPKKIEIWNGRCACPNCGKLYGNYSTFKQLTTWEMPYCKYCGQKLDWNVSDNTCVCCGEIIPEGRQICPKCEKG